MEPVGEGRARLHELSKAACESAAFYLPPPWTWVPTPIPTGRKQLQAWLHAIWHEGNRMEKRRTGSKSALMTPTAGLSSVIFPGHLNQQTQANQPGRDPARAASSCPFSATLPYSTLLLTEEPWEMGLTSPELSFLLCKVRMIKPVSENCWELNVTTHVRQTVHTWDPTSSQKWPPDFPSSAGWYAFFPRSFSGLSAAQHFFLHWNPVSATAVSSPASFHALATSGGPIKERDQNPFPPGDFTWNDSLKTGRKVYPRTRRGT